MRALSTFLTFCFTLTSVWQPVWAAQSQCQALFSATPPTKANPYQERILDLREFLNTIETLNSNDLGEQKIFSDLTKEILLDPERRLTDIEIAKISTNPKLLVFYKSFLSAMALAESSSRMASKALRFFDDNRHRHFFHEKGTISKVLRLIQAFYNGPFRFLFPTPLPRFQKPVDKIFQKQLKNPKYEPTTYEFEVLKAYKAEDVFKDKKDFLNSYNGWRIFRKWVSVIVFSLFISNTVLGINHDYHLTAGGSLAVSEYVSSPAYELKSNQVRIYNEGPIPHIAIEIGGSVYSYGVSHMTVKPRAQYLLETKLKEKIIKTQEDTNSWETPIKVIEKSGLSVQMITLNLTQSEHDRLRRDLELETGKRYQNHTLVTDCATMIAIALRNSTSVNINPLIDASPTWNMMYLSLLKSSGVTNMDGLPIVDGVFQVDRSDSRNPNKNIFRTSYLNIIEGKVALHILPYNLIHRAYLNVRYGEEGLHYWDPEVKNEIQKWEASFSETLLETQSYQQIIVFKERVRRLVLNQAPAEEIGFTRAVIENYLKEQINVETQILTNPNSKFYNLLQSAYRIHYYTQLSLSLTQQLESRRLDNTPLHLETDFQKVIEQLKF